MSKEWLEEKAAAMNEGAYLVVEGYEWTGLAVWRHGSFALPDDKFTWRMTECEELRLFDANGEWHCWRAGTEWDAKWRSAADWRERHIERKYILWGRDVTPSFNRS